MIKKIITLLYILCGSSALIWAQETPCGATTVSLQPCATSTLSYSTVTIGNTADLPSSGALCNSSYKDAWVKVVVPAGVEGVALYIDDYGGCGSFCYTDLTGQFYQQGATCSSLTPIGSCFNLDVTAAVANRIYNIPSGGGTFYLRITEDDDQGGWVRFGFAINSGDISTAPIPLASANGSYCNYWANGEDCSSVNGSTSCVGTVDNTIFYSFTVTAATPRPVNFSITNANCVTGQQSFQMVVTPTNCTGTLLKSECNLTSSSSQPQLSIPTIANGNYLLVVDGTAGAKCYWSLETTFNCDISNITVTPTSACNNNGTTGSTTDDYYTANVTVTYTNPPTSGNLVLSGSGSASVAVGSLGSSTSHTFTGVQLPANGSTASLTATFSATSSCSFTKTGITAVNNCSCTSTVSGATTLCSGSTTTLTANSGSSYAWATSGGTISGATNGISITAAAAGIYTVSVTNSVGCVASSSMTITSLALPTASISGTTSFCTGGNTVLTAAGGNSYAWSGGTPTNTAVTSITAAGTYTVTATAANGCTASSFKSVTVSSPPIVTLTGNSGVCSGSTTTLTASGGTGYAWTAGSGGTISSATNIAAITATTAGTYTVTVSNATGCTASSTKALTSLSSPASPAISGTPTVCSSGGATTTSLSVPNTFTSYAWATTGSITGSTTSNAIIAAAVGTYTATVTNSSGCSASSTIAVTAVVCTSVPVCEGNTFNASVTGAYTTSPYRLTYFTVCGGIVKGSNNDGIFNTASMGLTNAANASNCIVYAVNDDGTATFPAIGAAYSITGTSCYTTTNKSLLINARPTATISGTTNICSGGTTVLDAGAGFNSYAWGTTGGSISGASNAQTMTASAAGTYTVTVTNSSGCSSTSSVVVVSATCVCEGGSFTMTATGANTTAPYRLTYFTVCNGIVKGTSTTAVGSFSTAAMGLTNAANASNCFIYAVNDDGSVTLPAVGAAYNITNCNSQVSKPLVINYQPSAAITGTTSFCAGGSTTLSVPSGSNLTYSWTGASGGIISGATNTSSAIATTAGTYNVTVTHSAGCSANSSSAITVNANPTAAISGATSFCTAAGSTTLTASGGTSYAWATTGAISGASNTANAIAIAAGTYTVTVTNAANCTATAQQTITVGVSPTVGLSGGTTVCQNASNPILTASGATSYTWSSNTTNTTSTTAEVATTTAGTYTVTVTGTSAGCTATNTQVVVVTALPNIVVSGASSACQNSTNIPLSASGATTYSWSSNATNIAGATAEFSTTTAAGTYTVTVTGTSNSCTATGTLAITILAAPNPTIITDRTLTDCTNPSAMLTANGGVSYLWSNASTSNAITVTPTADATYTVTVTGANSCTATASEAISVNKTPPVVTTSYTQTCSNATITAAGAATYSWSPGGSTSNPLVVSASGIYTVVGTSGTNGCTATSSETISLSGSGTATNFGTFASAVSLRVNNTNAFHNTNTQQPSADAIGSNDFRNENIGTFAYRSSNLIFRGGEIKTWKKNSGNVCQPVMKYRIYPTSGTPGAFISQTYNFKCPCSVTSGTAAGAFTDGFGPCHVNDQKWDYLNIGNDLTTLCPDNYTLEVYYEIPGGDNGGCATTLYDNNVCANYKATFTISPFSTSLTPSGDITCAAPTTTLTASPVGTGITYSFSAGATVGAGATATVNTPNTYTVTVNHNGCSSSTIAIVTEDITPPVATATATTTSLDCTTPSTTLTATGVGTYAWNNSLGTSATTAAVSPVAASTTYTVTVTGANGCSSTASITITSNKTAPTLTVSGGGIACQGSTNIPLSATGAASYSWSSNASNISGGSAEVSTATVGIYTITVTGSNTNGCASTGTATVTIEDGSGNIYLAQTTTNALVLNRNCDNGGWTYYSDPADHSKLLFGINWAPDGTTAPGNAYAKEHAEVKIQVRPAGEYGESQPLGTSSLGTWTMNRWWEVHIPTIYSIDEPVNIQFFYSAAEKAAIEADAAAFQNANCANNYPNPPTSTKCGYEGFQWFKIDGVYSDNNISSAITPDNIVQSIPLANVNTSNTLSSNGVLYAQFNGLTSFSTGSGGVGVGPTNNPLPITILSFSGKINGEVNDLYWTTASEANSKWHVIERSHDGFTDWTEVGRKNGAGTTTSIHNYALTDSKPLAKSYYRLRNIDIDGSSQLSQVILLERKKGSFGFVGVYPNPTTGNVRIEYESENSALITLSVIDELGRVLQEKQVQTQRTGINDFDIDLSNYPDAVYMVMIDNGAKRNVTKVVKVKH